MRRESWPSLLARDLTPSHSPRWCSPGNCLLPDTQRPVPSPRAGLSPTGRRFLMVQSRATPHLPPKPGGAKPTEPRHPHLCGPHPTPISLATSLLALERRGDLGRAPPRPARGRRGRSTPLSAPRPAGWGLSPGPTLPPDGALLLACTDPFRTLSGGALPAQTPAPAMGSALCSRPPRQWAMGSGSICRGASQPGALGRHRVSPGAQGSGSSLGACRGKSQGPPVTPCPSTGVRPGSPARRGPGARLCSLGSAPKGPTQPGGEGRRVPGWLPGVC